MTDADWYQMQLWGACNSGDLPGAQESVGFGASIHRTGGPFASVPLAEACIHGHLHLVEWLLDHVSGAPDTLSALDSHKSTPLHSACAHSPPVARYLMATFDRARAHLLDVDSFGRTPFDVAASSGHVELVKWMLTLPEAPVDGWMAPHGPNLDNALWTPSGAVAWAKAEMRKVDDQTWEEYDMQCRMVDDAGWWLDGIILDHRRLLLLWLARRAVCDDVMELPLTQGCRSSPRRVLSKLPAPVVSQVSGMLGPRILKTLAAT